MNKNVINEIKQMKYMFGYKPGKVISEQNIPEMDDVMFAEPDVMEPEVKPDTDRDVEERPSRPGRPDRDPSRLPYTDPDTHPQGSDEETEYELEIDDMPIFSDEDETEYELEIDDMPKMGKPMGRMGMERPMGRRHRDENEPFMKKPMSRRHNDSDENEYEIEIDGDIEELFNR